MSVSNSISDALGIDLGKWSELVSLPCEFKIVVPLELEDEARGGVSDYVDDLAILACVSGGDEDCVVGGLGAVGEQR